jgi:hypothetical protein
VLTQSALGGLAESQPPPSSSSDPSEGADAPPLLDDGGFARSKLKGFFMECVILFGILGFVRFAVYVRWAQRNAWIWRKKEKKITGWDDFREAPKYDMVLPPESTIFDRYFFDPKTGASTGKSFSAVRFALILRARAILPMMWKVNQDHPEMSRLHSSGLLDTESFDAVDSAMAMMKAEIKDLEETAKKVGYIPTEDSPKNPNVWQFGKVLIDVKNRMEAEKQQRIAQHEEAERKRHEDEKLKRQAAKKKSSGSGDQPRAKIETEEEKADRIAKELMADEDNEKKKKKKKKKKNSGKQDGAGKGTKGKKK